ncbi:MAG: ATP-binding protein [Candidatus Magnetominusculus sp. LBB02]|nr:ATP-binding protein [Candidatus Magnetominusculus sp. LBB02]
MTNTGNNCKYGLCDGSGWVISSDSDGRETSHRCKCLLETIKQKKYESLLKESQIDDLRHMTFESYKPQHPTQKRAYEQTSAAHKGYYLFGPYGVGKTHLMAATVIRAIEKDVVSAIITVPKLLDTLRRYGDKDTAAVETLAYEADYLAIDDIGKHKITDWTEERLFMLIDERYKKFISRKIHTSVSSNLPPEQLSNTIDPAIVDRIRGMCTEVFVDGKSYRINGKL